MRLRSPSRYLLSAAVVPLLGAGAVALALLGPWSPLALDRADSRYLAGDVAGALAAYGEVADGWHFPDTRAEAARRAAMLALGIGHATTAAHWLRQATELEPDVGRRGEDRTQLAALYLDDFGDPVRAAEEYERAAVERGTGETVLAAARCWERAGQAARAREAYAKAAATLPEGRLRDEAQVGFARTGADGSVDAG